MKKTYKIILLLMLLVFTLAGSVFANENEYILIREYSYKNEKKSELSEAYIKILIGSGDFVQYQNDESLTISPTPDQIEEDNYGNQIAYYDLSGIKPGAKFNITVKRKVTLDTYLTEIPNRANTEIQTGFKKYLNPQERIETEDPEIISKAKELTEDIASDYKKAEAIFKFVNVNLSYDTSEAYANKGASSALKNRKGACEEFATLFVAMCRAVNIPSRVITGCWIQYEEVEQSGEKVSERQIIDHAWAEIYLQDFGWVPVEPTYFLMNGTTKVANLNAFCKLDKPDHIASGVYNYEIPDRLYTRNLTEVSLSQRLEDVDNTSGEVKPEFTDIKNLSWAKDAIEFLRELNVVNGYSETTFGPQNNISRIEFISMLSRALKYKETPYEEGGAVYYYLDYNKSHWSKNDYDYLMRCYQAVEPSHAANMGFDCIANIFDEGKLNMNKPITRAEVVALIDVFLPSDNALPKLNDIWGNKFERSIVKAYNYGLIVGYADNTFKPNNNITRAEIAVILERYIGNEIYNII